jgi:hypothetical protein
MLVEPYCCLFEGVDSRFRGNDRGQVLKDAKLQLKPPKKSTYNRDVHPPRPFGTGNTFDNTPVVLVK